MNNYDLFTNDELRYIKYAVDKQIEALRIGALDQSQVDQNNYIMLNALKGKIEAVEFINSKKNSFDPAIAVRSILDQTDDIPLATKSSNGIADTTTLDLLNFRSTTTSVDSGESDSAQNIKETITYKK